MPGQHNQTAGTLVGQGCVRVKVYPATRTFDGMTRVFYVSPL